MARRANNLKGREWLRNSISVWRDITRNSVEKKTPHPAVFPSGLVERLLDSFVCRSEESRPLVCDPFLGSGTSLLVAAKKGFSGIGFELSESYFRLACERLQTCREPLCSPGPAWT